MLTETLARMPLVAILRGVRPDEVVAVTATLIEAGFGIIEVPLNSPEPIESIRKIADAFGEQVIIGGGTVLSTDDVEAIHGAGGKLIFSPNCNLDVVRKTKALSMISMPGCCTPSEAFAALEAGADAIKFFPADLVTPAVVKSMCAVLPACPLLAVGGINNSNLAAYLEAGITGFGIGSSLYKSGKSLADLRQSADEIISAFEQARSTSN